MLQVNLLNEQKNMRKLLQINWRLTPFVSHNNYIINYNYKLHKGMKKNRRKEINRLPKQRNLRSIIILINDNPTPLIGLMGWVC